MSNFAMWTLPKLTARCKAVAPFAVRASIM